MNFVWHEWLSHSNYSFLIGASDPKDLYTRSYELGYQSLALSDYNGVYGSAQAHAALKKLRKTGIAGPKLIHGIEFSLNAMPETPLSLQDTLVLLAKSKEGYRNLCALASEAHRDGGKKPTLSLEALSSFPKKDLIALQPMRGIIRSERPDFCEERYKFYKDLFGSAFHLILSRHLNPIEDRWIRPTLELSKKLEIPTLFSQDAYFHKPSEKILHDVIQAIRLNEPLDKIMPYLFVNEERCLRELDLLEKRYSIFPDYKRILLRSQELAESFQFSFDELKYQYPKEFIPEQFTPYSYLEDLLRKQSQKRFPQGMPDRVRHLLEKELWLVYEMQLADYFLTVWDIVRWAREQGILCQGRGSAANSVICFILEITSLDPTKGNPLFERFLSRERGEPPDIDVDFEHERREEVLQYVYQRYGRRRAAMVANVICFRGKSAFRAIGKAFGVPESWIGQVADFRSSYRRAVETPPLPKEIEDGISPYCDWGLWQRLAGRIKGFPRHLGIHSGGFVLSDEDLDGLCPQEPATMEGRTVIQWSKDDIETLEIFKIDLLALGMLSALRKAFATVKEHYGQDLAMYKLPVDDPKTFAMIQRGDTVGTFQVESRAQMSMLPRLKPKTFYELAVQIGIIRPGPIQGGLIHPYIRRRQGLETITYPDERLVPILERTLGIPIFQEQIMRMAMAVGGFTGDEADELRKKIGAWSMGKDLSGIVEKLRAGLLRNNVAPAFVEQIIEYLHGFSEYGFPESHAISFALIAYASCYLKCYYPVAFYLSIINSQPMGFYSVHALIQSARREGIGFLPPNINYSHWDSSIETFENGRKLIRLGFHLIRGLSEETAKRIVELREKRSEKIWPNLKAFIHDLEGTSRRDLSALAAANSFATFAIPRRDAIWFMESLPHAPLLDEELAYTFSPEEELEKMELDFSSFCSSLDKHPTLLIREHAWRFPVKLNQLKNSQSLLNSRQGESVYVFGMVLIRQSPPTAKGILFVTLEDEAGFINLVCKPKTIERFRAALWQDTLLCVKGQVQRDRDSLSILVDTVYSQTTGVHILRPEDNKPPLEKIFENAPAIRSFR